MNINQTGVSTPFAFAGTGDHLFVRGTIGNLLTATTAVVTSLQAGNIISNGGLIASFGTGDAVLMTGGGKIINNAQIVGAIATDATVNFTNAGRFAGYFVSTQAGPGVGSRIVNKGAMMLSETAGGTAHVAGALISLGSADDSVVNSGQMMGDVWLGDGNNSFDTRLGMIMGKVHGGTGNDTYMFSEALAIDDAGGIDTLVSRSSFTLGKDFENLTLSGFGNFTGTGNTAANVLTGNANNNYLDGLGNDDTLLGGAGADTLDGSFGADSLEGQRGNDSLIGNYGEDTLLGGDGNDTMSGGTGADSLAGGNGADLMAGDIGADTMEGGDGADVLIGGAFGTDVMTGGAGADSFVYLTADDSFATQAADIITDFTQGEDVIDLALLDPGSFAFSGLDPFTGGAPGLRYRALATGDTAVLIDLNGDGTAEMQVILTGGFVLTAADFIL
jgi:serralysin